MSKTLISKVKIGSRAQANFVYDISQVKGNLYITKNDRTINAKSILGLLSINIDIGDEVVLMADNEEIVSRVVEYFE